MSVCQIDDSQERILLCCRMDDETDEDKEQNSEVDDTNADSDEEYELAPDYEYESDVKPEEAWTWLTRCVLTDGRKLECLDVQNNSIIIKNTSASQALEFAENKILVTVQDGTHILLIANWEVITVIKDPSNGNWQKYWIQKMPGFDEETFPFCITQGAQSFNLINVKLK